MRRTVYYSGRVQGVGFRYTAQSIAQEFRVSGYVRNLPDGRVELVAEGEPGEVERFVARVGEVMKRNIHEVRVSDAAATGQYKGFTIERG